MFRGCCKTPRCTFSASLVGTDRQISGLNLKIAPKSQVFDPFDPPTKEVTTCLIIIAKVKSSQTFFVLL